MGFAETANLAVRIGLDDKLSPGLAKTTRNLGRFEKGIGRASRGVGQVGKGLAKAGLVAGGIVATGLAAVAAAAIDFDDAFAGVRKTLNQADLDKAGLTFKDLETQIRGLATAIPVSASDIARIAEEAGALGVAAGSVVEFSRVVAELAVTTNLTTDSASEALGKLGTILKLSGKDYEHFADVLVNLGNNGASTEADIVEITKRFAASGKQAGLATEEILALSSAISSMGVEPEAAGGALSRLFANMGTNIALANEKGKAFAKLIGKPISQLQKDINKGRGLPLFIKLLEKLRGASKTDAYKILAGVGITATRDRDAIVKLAQGYDVLNDQLKIAKTSQGALGKEAEKRFNTVRSSLQLLKNNLIEAALVIGGDASDPKSFIGSIGVAAKKFSAFLKDPENRRQLEQFGRGLGDAITSIDFDKLLNAAKGVARVLEPALQTLLKIAELIGKLPPEVIGVAGGAIVADRFSGGAISSGLGNIVGGLGESIARAMAAQIPVFGKAFVQPVYVTNPGFGGGPSGGGGSTPPVTPATGIVTPAIGAGIFWPTFKEDVEHQNKELIAALQAHGEKISGLPAEFEKHRFVPPPQGPTIGPAAGPTAGRIEFDPVTKKLAGLQAKLDQTLKLEGRATRNNSTQWLAKLQAKEDRIRAAINAAKAEQAAKLNAANARLGRIAAKDLSVTVNTSTSVSLTAIANGQKTYVNYRANGSKAHVL